MAPDRATVRPRMMRASTLDVLSRAVQDGDVAGHDEAWAELVEAGDVFLTDDPSDVVITEYETGRR